MKSIGFYKTNILLSKENLEKWSTLACDQFTSNIQYWGGVAKIAKDYNSAYNIIFPEVYLEKIDFDNKVRKIHSKMKEYLDSNIFDEYKDSMFYVERTLIDGSVRKGIIGVLDLEEYDFNPGAESLIRATEGTVVNRLPPRIKIREGAYIDIPHILVLIDDEKKQIIEYFSNKKETLKKLYSFDLMKKGGHIEGYLLEKKEIELIENRLSKLLDKKYFQEKYKMKGISPFLFAIGDGNHSLAAAKSCYEKLKEELGEGVAKKNSARFPLVELNNLHDDSLKFQGIHRLVFNIDQDYFLNKLEEYCNENKASIFSSQYITIVKDSKKRKIEIKNPIHNLAVGSIQIFLDKYLEKFGGNLDYIHGEEETIKLSKNGKIGIILDTIKKSDLFKTIILQGALPRKSFSMGEASEKRYYLECKKIK